jgi:hypothetical protein
VTLAATKQSGQEIGLFITATQYEQRFTARYDFDELRLPAEAFPPGRS